MNVKCILLSLLPLVAVFVNSYGLHSFDEIEYKGVKASSEWFVQYCSDFRDNVYIYAPTKNDKSGQYYYERISLVKNFKTGPDTGYDSAAESKMIALMEEKNIDIDNFEQGINYCQGNDDNDPALYVTKKGSTVNCDDFYKFVKQHGKQ